MRSIAQILVDSRVNRKPDVLGDAYSSKSAGLEGPMQSYSNVSLFRLFGPRPKLANGTGCITSEFR